MVHIGDLERTDIIGARQAGYRAIRFTGITPLGDNETSVADFVTDDLTEVPRLVEMLGALNAGASREEMGFVVPPSGGSS